MDVYFKHDGRHFFGYILLTSVKILKYFVKWHQVSLETKAEFESSVLLEVEPLLGST